MEPNTDMNVRLVNYHKGNELLRRYDVGEKFSHEDYSRFESLLMLTSVDLPDFHEYLEGVIRAQQGTANTMLIRHNRTIQQLYKQRLEASFEDLTSTLDTPDPRVTDEDLFININPTTQVTIDIVDIFLELLDEMIFHTPISEKHSYQRLQELMRLENISYIIINYFPEDRTVEIPLICRGETFPYMGLDFNPLDFYLSLVPIRTQENIEREPTLAIDLCFINSQHESENVISQINDNNTSNIELIHDNQGLQTPPQTPPAQITRLTPPPAPGRQRQANPPTTPVDETPIDDQDEIFMELIQDLYHDVRVTNVMIGLPTYMHIQERMQEFDIVYITAYYQREVPTFIFSGLHFYDADIPIEQQMPNDLEFETIYIINDALIEDNEMLLNLHNTIARRNVDLMLSLDDDGDVTNETPPPPPRLLRTGPIQRPPTPPPFMVVNPMEVHFRAGEIFRNDLWNKIRNILYKNDIQPGHYILKNLPGFPRHGLTRENIKLVLIKFVELTNRSSEYKRNRVSEIQNIFSVFVIELGPDQLNLIRMVFDYMFYLDIPELYAKYISKVNRGCLQAYAPNQGNEMNENRDALFEEMGMSCVNGRLERLYAIALELFTFLANDNLLTSAPPVEAVPKISELKSELGVGFKGSFVTRNKIERLFNKWVTEDVPLPDNQAAEEQQADPLVGKSVEEIKSHASNYIQRGFVQDNGADFSQDRIGLRMIEEYLNTIEFRPISVHRGELLYLLGGKKRSLRNKKKTRKQKKKGNKTNNKTAVKKSRKTKSINERKYRKKTRSRK